MMVHLCCFEGPYFEIIKEGYLLRCAVLGEIDE
jgi:hypothetical protein